jgi:hypothetical protein
MDLLQFYPFLAIFGLSGPKPTDPNKAHQDSSPQRDNTDNFSYFLTFRYRTSGVYKEMLSIFADQ